MADTMLDNGVPDAPESLADGLAANDVAANDPAGSFGESPQGAEPAIQHLPRADEPVASMEIYCNSFTTAAPEKLSAIAGVVSAYNRFLVGVRGRSPDDLEAKDVQQLGTMIGAMLGIEVQPATPQGRMRSGSQRR